MKNGLYSSNRKTETIIRSFKKLYILYKTSINSHRQGKFENKPNEISVLKHTFEKQASNKSCSCPVTRLGKYETLP